MLFNTTIWRPLTQVMRLREKERLHADPFGIWKVACFLLKEELEFLESAYSSFVYSPLLWSFSTSAPLIGFRYELVNGCGVCILRKTEFNFQIPANLRYKKSPKHMRVRNGIYKVYLYFDWPSRSCTNFHFILTYVIYELQLYLQILTDIFFCWSFTVGMGRKKLSKNPHQNPAHLSSKLHSIEDI